MKHIKVFENFVTPVNEFDSKDSQRINDIVTKSNKDEVKMLKLATQMANIITDKNKAFNRGAAAESILGKDHPVTLVFFDRAKALGVDVAGIKSKPVVLPGSQRPESKKQKPGQPGYRGISILPCGSLNLKTGENKYFNVRENGESVIEVWKLRDGAIRLVITSGTSPIYAIGQHERFIHDQSHRDLFNGEMIDYIESEHMEVLIPLYGKSANCYVYK